MQRKTRPVMRQQLLFERVDETGVAHILRGQPDVYAAVAPFGSPRDKWRHLARQLAGDCVHRDAPELEHLVFAQRQHQAVKLGIAPVAHLAGAGAAGQHFPQHGGQPIMVAPVALLHGVERLSAKQVVGIGRPGWRLPNMARLRHVGACCQLLDQVGGLGVELVQAILRGLDLAVECQREHPPGGECRVVREALHRLCQQAGRLREAATGDQCVGQIAPGRTVVGCQLGTALQLADRTVPVARAPQDQRGVVERPQVIGIELQRSHVGGTGDVQLATGFGGNGQVGGPVRGHQQLLAYRVQHLVRGLRLPQPGQHRCACAGSIGIARVQRQRLFERDECVFGLSAGVQHGALSHVAREAAGLIHGRKGGVDGRKQ